jgi:hypothetical protein
MAQILFSCRLFSFRESRDREIRERAFAVKPGENM